MNALDCSGDEIPLSRADSHFHVTSRPCYTYANTSFRTRLSAPRSFVSGKRARYVRPRGFCFRARVRHSLDVLSASQLLSPSLPPEEEVAVSEHLSLIRQEFRSRRYAARRSFSTIRKYVECLMRDNFTLGWITHSIMVFCDNQNLREISYEINIKKERERVREN